MGTMANELTLGCDCLGQIHYLVRNRYRTLPPAANDSPRVDPTSDTMEMQLN